MIRPRMAEDDFAVPEHFGGTLLSIGRLDRGAFKWVDRAGDGAFDRIADLARFLLDAEVGIVDLRDSSEDLGSGVSVAPQGTSGLAQIADPVAALKLGFASQASVPIRAGRERIGTLAVVSGESRAFDERDVETLRRLAELVAESVSLRICKISR